MQCFAYMRTFHFHFHFQFEKKNVFKVRVEGPDHLESQKSVKRASKKRRRVSRGRKKMFPSVFRKTNLNFFILFVVVAVVVKTLRMQKTSQLQLIQCNCYVCEMN